MDSFNVLEWAGPFVVSYAVVIDVDTAEERVVQEPSDTVLGPHVQLGGVIEQVQVSPEKVDSLREILAAVDELSFGRLTFGLQLAESDSDAAAREFLVGEQVEQLLLLTVDACENSPNVGLNLTDGALLVGHGLDRVDTQFGNEVSRQGHGGVVLFDELFDLPRGQVREVADALLPTAAEEVRVPASVTAGCFGVDEPAGAALDMAPFTEQQSLQVVGQDAVALAVAAALFEDVLDAFEERLADQRIVPPGIGLSLVGHDSGVVIVAEHLVELVQGNGLGWPVGRGPGRQSLFGHRGLEPFEAVFAGGVQRPRHADQRCSLLVHGHRVDQAAFVFDARVQVADGCPTDGAAAFDLLAHFVADVRAVGL